MSRAFAGFVAIVALCFLQIYTLEAILYINVYVNCCHSFIHLVRPLCHLNGIYIAIFENQ